MTWGKLHDRLMLDEKVQTLLAMKGGHEAFTLYISGLVYATGELTDGRLTPAATACAAELAHVNPSRADLLGTVKLWRKKGPNWWISNFKKYNPTAAQVRQERVTTASRVARWREAKANLDGNGVTAPSMRGRCNGAPVPSRPVPSQERDVVSSEHLQLPVRSL